MAVKILVVLPLSFGMDVKGIDGGGGLSLCSEYKIWCFAPLLGIFFAKHIRRHINAAKVASGVSVLLLWAAQSSALCWPRKADQLGVRLIDFLCGICPRRVD